jgi:O-antigen/teichoic acid export membrane protein
VLKNVAVNWLLTLTNIAVTAVLMPYSLHALGDQAYGTWLLIASVTGYLNLLQLGVPMASVRHLTQRVAVDDDGGVEAVLATCVGLFAALAGAALLVSGALLAAFLLGYDIPPALRTSAAAAFMLLSVTLSLRFIGQVAPSVLIAHHDFVARGAILIVALLARFAFTLVVLGRSRSLVALAAAQALQLVLEIGLTLAYIRHRYPKVRLRLRRFDRTAARGILGFSVYVLVLNVGGQLAFQTDSLVIGKALDVGLIPAFTVASSVLVYLMEFIIGIAAVMMPMATALQARGQQGELRALFLKWSKIAATLTALPTLFLLVAGPPLLGVWIGPAYAESSGRVLQVLAIGNLLFLPVRGVALPLLLGIGRPKHATLAFLATGVANLVLSVALARPLGLVGVALGTAVPNAVFAAAVLRIACREIDLPVGEWMRYVAARTALGMVALLAAAAPARPLLDGAGLGGLVVFGVLLSAVFAAVWALFVYRRDPHVDVSGFLARFFAARVLRKA